MKLNLKLTMMKWESQPQAQLFPMSRYGRTQRPPNRDPNAGIRLSKLFINYLCSLFSLNPFSLSLTVKGQKINMNNLLFLMNTDAPSCE